MAAGATATDVTISVLSVLPKSGVWIEQLFEGTVEGRQASMAEALRQLELGRMVYVGREAEVLAILRQLGPCGAP
jgi:hypothetical protein